MSKNYSPRPDQEKILSAKIIRTIKGKEKRNMFDGERIYLKITKARYRRENLEFFYENDPSRPANREEAVRQGVFITSTELGELEMCVSLAVLLRSFLDLIGRSYENSGINPTKSFLGEEE
jgi:hypothetical protein